ncbi:MAG: LEA type 2 family protein [Gammaproteobacteria bacterium]|nr:LEA type 2 family protein [Gammaproteobacteria bacterium]
MMRFLLVLLSSLGFAACSGLPWNAVAPKVSVADVGIKSLGLLEQRLDVGLRISNPNDFALTIEALELELEVNARPFASGVSREVTRVPAVASAMLRVDTFMQSKDLIQQLKTLSQGGLKAGVPYRLKGRFKTDQSSRWQSFDRTGVVGADEKNTQGKSI